MSPFCLGVLNGRRQSQPNGVLGPSACTTPYWHQDLRHLHHQPSGELGLLLFCLARAEQPLLPPTHLLPARGKTWKIVPASSGIGLAPANGKESRHLQQTPINHCRPEQGRFEGEPWEGKRAMASSSPRAAPHLQESPAECQGPATTAHRSASLPRADRYPQDHLQQRKPRLLLPPGRMSPSGHPDVDHP